MRNNRAGQSRSAEDKILRASPRAISGCWIYECSNEIILEKDLPEWVKHQCTIGDIVVTPASDDDTNELTLRGRWRENHYIVTDESRMVKKIVVEHDVIHSMNKIKIPAEVCEKAGMFPHWSEDPLASCENSRRPPRHPIKYFSHLIVQLYGTLSFLNDYGHRPGSELKCGFEVELTPKQYKLAESLPEKPDGWRSWPILDYQAWRKQRVYKRENKGVEFNFVVELELTPEQYNVAESLPEKDGWRSWPRLAFIDSPVRRRQISTEVKFKLLPRDLADELFEDTLPYEVRKIITSHIPGTTILLL